MNRHAKTTIAALEQTRGDNTGRALAAFRGMTPRQLDQEHPNSGKTRREILAAYQAHDRKVDGAIAWVKGKEARQIKMAKRLERVIHALDEYHEALDRREHGGVAQDKAIKAIEAVFARPWIRK